MDAGSVGGRRRQDAGQTEGLPHVDIIESQQEHTGAEGGATPPGERHEAGGQDQCGESDACTRAFTGAGH
jgi:hypothetical protein